MGVATDKAQLEAILAQLVASLQQTAQTQTEAAAALRGLSANNVLESAIVQLSSDRGVAERSYQVPYGSVAVTNHSAGQLIVMAGPVPATVGESGQGMHRVGAGQSVTVALTGTILGLSGRPSGRVSIQVWSKAQPPSGGSQVWTMMGTHVWARHGTLVAAAVTAVTLPALSTVEVLNRHTANPLWVTTTGTAPTVAGDDTIVVPPGSSVLLSPRTTDLRMISDAATPYSVTQP